jgi:hypothetical protein
MEREVGAPRELRERMAGGLGRIVTDYLAFSESRLGGELLKLADDFAEAGL